ncbi:MAG: hypothetical protein U0Q55_06130 [Vicinamibacterales bacterium]
MKEIVVADTKTKPLSAGKREKLEKKRRKLQKKLNAIEEQLRRPPAVTKAAPSRKGKAVARDTARARKPAPSSPKRKKGVGPPSAGE